MPQAKANKPTAPSPQFPTFALPTFNRILWWGSQKSRTSSEDEQSTVPVPLSPSKTRRQPYIECSSGQELKTHNRIVDAQPDCIQSAVVTHHDVFVCSNGVDTKRLLVLSRNRVLERAEALGGNSMIDESWSCTICKQETKRGTCYRVSISYQGTPARSNLPDPRRPVAMDFAQGIPGLMTVLSRQGRYEGPTVGAET